MIIQLVKERKLWPLEAVKDFQRYGIDPRTPEGQNALIEIAKLAPQQNGTGTSKFIKDYGIDASTPEGQKALIEIAKLAAQQDGTGTSEYIENYGIDRSTPNGRQVLIEIAKLAAQQDGEYTSKYINNYGIDASSPEGQQALIEIVKLAAQQNGTGTSKYINNYDIRDAIQLGIPLLDIDSAVLKGNFQTTRYTTDNNPHLAEIEQHYLQIFENWKLSVALKDAELGIKDTGKAIPVEKRVVETLKQAVENQHLGLERQEALFPILDACKGKWELLDQPLKLIAQQLAPLLNRRLSTEEIERKKCLLLQKAFLELIKNPGELEKKLNILKGIKIKGLDEDLKPFYRDLEDGVKFMHSSGQPKAEGYKVIDTDDPNHFLLMGTEVLNSCQNVNGSASLNVGLLGYAMDGKHRLALVCDPEGKILARSVLRLLLDAEGKPVIFQERMYVADANPAYPQLLRKMALKKASLLAIPLVVSPADFEIEQAKKYPLSIQAKAKPVPFEYVDALGGLRNGPYTISNALHIYTM